MRWRWNVRRNQRKVHLWSSFETRRNLQAEARYGHAFQTALFQTVERSEKVHATIPKDFVWFCVQSSSSRNFWRMVRETIEACLLPVCREQCIDHIPYCLSGLSRPHFFSTTFRETESDKYALLTKREVKMAGFWPSSFLCFIYRDKVEVNKKRKKNRPIYSHKTERAWSIIYPQVANQNEGFPFILRKQKKRTNT